MNVHKFYTPSGKVTFHGLLLMPAFGFLGTVMGSYLYFLFKAHLCTIVLLFPLVLGGIAGGGVALGVHWGKIRNTVIAGILGAAAGLLAFGMTFYWGYLDLQNYVQSYALEEWEEILSDDEALTLTDQIIGDETGHTGLYGYAFFSIDSSRFSLFRIGRSSFDAYEFGETTPSWINRIIASVELLAAVLAAWLMAHSEANSRFCEKDHRWFKSKTVLTNSPESAENLTKAILADDYNLALSYVSPPADPKQAMDIKVDHCPTCRDGVMEIGVGTGMKHKAVYSQKINEQQFSELEKLGEKAKEMLKNAAEKPREEMEKAKE